jgi:hypothetical protein
VIEEYYSILPYPYSHFALEGSLPPLDAPCIIGRLLEDCGGLAGVLASATAAAECDQQSVIYASRLLAELLHSTVALWDQWREEEDPDEEPDAAAPAPSPAHTAGSPRARKGLAGEDPPGWAGREGEA